MAYLPRFTQVRAYRASEADTRAWGQALRPIWYLFAHSGHLIGLNKHRHPNCSILGVDYS